MKIDDELREVEERIEWRRERLAQSAHESRAAAKRVFTSPATIAVVALAGGALAGAAVLRYLRRRNASLAARSKANIASRWRQAANAWRHAPDGAREPDKTTAAARAGGMLALLLPWGLALARARLGSRVASPHWTLADFVVSRFRRP
jgi:hypothetical protein